MRLNTSVGLCRHDHLLSHCASHQKRITFVSWGVDFEAMNDADGILEETDKREGNGFSRRPFCDEARCIIWPELCTVVILSSVLNALPKEFSNEGPAGFSISATKSVNVRQRVFL